MHLVPCLRVSSLLISLALTACASSPAAAPVAAAPRTPERPKAPGEMTKAERCQEGLKWRQEGLTRFTAADFSGARAAFERSLDYDPTSRGAHYHLDLIDAVESGRQNVTESGMWASECDALIADAQAAKADARALKPVADIDGQIITYSKGTASENFRLSHDVIYRAVRDINDQLVACYARGLQADPSLQGQVAIEFEVTSDGRASASHARRSTVASEEVVECLTKALGALKFARQPAAVSVIYPLVLRTETNASVAVGRR